jgi:hypothetical protein
LRRCPYLEEYYREARGPLRIYHFDCHVDKRSKRKLSLLSEHPPICVRTFEDCPLYQLEKRREDGLITRYTD